MAIFLIFKNVLVYNVMKRDVLGSDNFLIPVAKSFLNANVMGLFPW